MSGFDRKFRRTNELYAATADPDKFKADLDRVLCELGHKPSVDPDKLESLAEVLDTDLEQAEAAHQTGRAYSLMAELDTPEIWARCSDHQRLCSVRAMMKTQNDHGPKDVHQAWLIDSGFTTTAYEQLTPEEKARVTAFMANIVVFHELLPITATQKKTEERLALAMGKMRELGYDVEIETGAGRASGSGNN